jgi:hypothetical protein
MKVKIFLLLNPTSSEQHINRWLQDHQNIDVISVKVTDNQYIILYKEINKGSDADEVD